MKKSYFYLLYSASGNTYKFSPSWLDQNAKFFCKTCYRQKDFSSALDIVIDGEIRERADMIFAVLLPRIMSFRMLDTLGSEAFDYLNIGKMFSE